MGTSLAAHSVNGTKDKDQATSAQDRKLLGRLVKLWKSQAEHDHGTRYETGRLLNERLGPPNERQPQGRRVLKQAAERLGIAESDLNRMRWYAHLLVSHDLRQSHPEIDSWTKFKEALPSLKVEFGYEARKPAANPSRPALGVVAKSLANLTAKLNGLDLQPGDAEWEKFVEGLRGLAEAASRRLKIRVVVAVE
jgi:hypothetical protein